MGLFDHAAIAVGTVLGWASLAAYFIHRPTGDRLIELAVPLLLERPER